MTSYFPDINVWIALAFRAHQHHERAKDWFEHFHNETAGFCRFTQLGFLRLLTHPAVMRNEVKSSAEAWKAYNAFLSDPRLTFYVESDSESLEAEFRAITHGKRFSHGQWPDAYLAAFAKVHGLKLVTFDRGLRTLTGGQAELLA